MANANAERQADYRKKHLVLESGTKERLNMLVRAQLRQSWNGFFSLRRNENRGHRATSRQGREYYTGIANLHASNCLLR